jgi:hypothetical protein
MTFPSESQSRARSPMSENKRRYLAGPAGEAIAHWKERLGDPLFVYFIQAEDGGPVKIGQALDPVKRLRQLQCGNPQNLVIREVILAAVDTEERLHGYWMSDAGMRGEWFGCGFEDEILRCAAQASSEQLSSDSPPHYIAGDVCVRMRKIHEAKGWVSA